MKREYFAVHTQVHIKGRWFLGDHSSTDEKDRQRLWDGEPVRGSLTIDPQEGGNGLPFTLTTFGIAVATNRVAKQIAEIAGADVQIVPVTIEGYSDFKVINCLRTIDCIDESRSLFERYPEDDLFPHRRGSYRGFEKLIIDVDRVPPDANFFRAAGWQVKFIASQRIKDLLAPLKDSGARFESVTKG